ncbi:MAG: 16S rRNA processing protein RimM [Proteiniphilum sp.]|jgi:16S rRNA processing protein RimM|nr:16S rRNA processing protein RimM [Proteiniphilum sp.]
MISEKDILQVGRTQKPYGIKGEIILLFHKAEYAELDTEYYFLEIDGLPVPFFVEEFTFSTNVSARVKFTDVDDEKSASRYVNTDVYLPRERLKPEQKPNEDDWNYFLGYTIVDQHGVNLGTIEEVDETTQNILFIVKSEEKEHLIPATDDFIAAIDEENKIIEMYLPEGLTDE